ncbi:MAG: TetR family transcriptional regulator [Nitrospira sp.]|nr:TetR family transcriptional regulator [Nitrospira sp.]
MKPPKSLPPADTRLSILDASEYLFANEGYRGTTLRAITKRAGVNLAAVNYHFGSKETLLEEVIKRRIEPLNMERRRRIQEVQDLASKKGKKPVVKSVLQAFITPTLEFRDSEPGARDFITFIGRAFADPDDSVRKVFVRFMHPIFELMHRTMCLALPDYPADLVFWRLQFCMGSLFTPCISAAIFTWIHQMSQTWMQHPLMLLLFLM